MNKSPTGHGNGDNDQKEREEARSTATKSQTDNDPIICLVPAPIIPIRDAAAHPLRRTEGRWSSMGTAEWFPISSCSSSLPPCPSEGEQEVPRPGGGGGGGGL